MAITCELGLDSQIQYDAEIALADGVISSEFGVRNADGDGHEDRRDPRLGAVPVVQREQLRRRRRSQDFRDLAVSQPYEPGSTMKVITFAGGLNNKAFTPNTVIDEKQSRIDGYLIHDWDDRSHGRITMQWVLDDSLNNGAIDAGKLEGQNDFYSNLLAFGIGAPDRASTWRVRSTIRCRRSRRGTTLRYAEASFGQGVVATPSRCSPPSTPLPTAASGCEPHVVDAIVNPNTGTTTPRSSRRRAG